MKMGFVLKAHDDLNEGHKMISISAYRESIFSNEMIYCEIHKSEPATIGCRICWIILCPCCISSSGNCIGGECYRLLIVRPEGKTMIANSKYNK